MSLVNWNRLVRSTNCGQKAIRRIPLDRKSTRLNSSHGYISYAVFCLKKKTFDPPLEGQSDLAVGYQFVSGSYRPAPVGYFYVAPAVSLVTTGADIGRFLIGLLGRASDSLPILRPETVQLMEARHFALQPGGPGVAYGLYEWPEIGERDLVHGGLGHGFSNLLVLLPDRH